MQCVCLTVCWHLYKVEDQLEAQLEASLASLSCSVKKTAVILMEQLHLGQVKSLNKEKQFNIH